MLPPLERLLGVLPKDVRRLAWVADRLVPWAPVTFRQAGRLARARGFRRPAPCWEVSFGKIESADLWLNGSTLWLANQAGDLGWHIGIRPFGESQFVLKVI